MKYYRGNYETNFKDKAKSDPMTTADLKSEDYIRKRIAEEFPEDQILSEEQEDENLDFSKRVWIVDPMDGTRPFVKKMPGFSVIIGLCDDGIPVLGVVYVPLTDELYYAEKGKGAFVIKQNKKPEKISVSSEKEISKARSLPSIRFFSDPDFKKKLEKIGIGKVLRVFAGCGVKSVSVASGKVELYNTQEAKAKKWDTCGTQVIVEEAGGKYTDVNGKSLNYKQEDFAWKEIVAVSNGILHDEFTSKLRKL